MKTMIRMIPCRLLSLSLLFTGIVSGETDGEKLSDKEMANQLAAKPATLPPGVKTRSIQVPDERMRSGRLSEDALVKTRSAIDLARKRAVRLNLTPSGTNENQAIPLMW